MFALDRDGVRLAYADTDPASTHHSSMLLIHGWCGDHTLMAAQAAAFAPSHRVISVDLRGYGDSDAPEQEYTMAAFADDVAWLSEQVALVRPVVVGHSMGGNVALELAARHHHIPGAVVMIDTRIFPPPELNITAALDSIVASMSGPDYVTVANRMLKSLYPPTDTFGCRTQPTDSLHAPQHVILSCLRNHATDESATVAASACKVPIAYIAASRPRTGVEQFRRLTPQLQIGRVLGAGTLLSTRGTGAGERDDRSIRTSARHAERHKPG